MKIEVEPQYPTYQPCHSTGDSGKSINESNGAEFTLPDWMQSFSEKVLQPHSADWVQCGEFTHCNSRPQAVLQKVPFGKSCTQP